MNNIKEFIYYFPRGYWKGKSAIGKVTSATKVNTTAKDWLSKQAIWHIYLPLPKQISFSHFDVSVPNEVHQADILFMPHDGVYKYALTVVNVASRYKQAEPLKTKSSTEVASAFERVYRQVPLDWPNLLQVDPGKEFQGAVLSSIIWRSSSDYRKYNPGKMVNSISIEYPLISPIRV